MSIELLVAAIVFLGGLVKGFNGFGYAIASTAILAVILTPPEAVTIMILPIMAANMMLLTEIEINRFKSCVKRFWIYILAAAAGTVAGMFLIDTVPVLFLKPALGLFVLAFVFNKIGLLQFQMIKERCFKDLFGFKLILGAISGFIFGVSNVGVQFVSYLEALDLDRPVFVGVLAMIMLGVSTVRIGTASVLGMYKGEVFLLSLIAVIPGVIGVKTGEFLGKRVSEKVYRLGSYGLLSFIGFYLLLTPF